MATFQIAGQRVTLDREAVEQRLEDVLPELCASTMSSCGAGVSRQSRP